MCECGAPGILRAAAEQREGGSSACGCMCQDVGGLLLCVWACQLASALTASSISERLLARHTLRTDSSGWWKQRRWRRWMEGKGGSLRVPLRRPRVSSVCGTPGASPVSPRHIRDCRRKTGKKGEINLFARLSGRVSVHLRGPGLVRFLFFHLRGGGGGVEGSGPGAERLADASTGREQAWLASTGAWLPSSAGASSSSPASSHCGGPSETR